MWCFTISYGLTFILNLMNHGISQNLHIMICMKISIMSIQKTQDLSTTTQFFPLLLHSAQRLLYSYDITDITISGFPIQQTKPQTMIVLSMVKTNSCSRIHCDDSHIVQMILIFISMARVLLNVYHDNSPILLVLDFYCHCCFVHCFTELYKNRFYLLIPFDRFTYPVPSSIQMATPTKKIDHLLLGIGIFTVTKVPIHREVTERFHPCITLCSELP